jgi:hypothetical protein
VSHLLPMKFEFQRQLSLIKDNDWDFNFQSF